MPILIYRDSHGYQREYTFTDEISIGSDSERCGVVLPAEAGVAPWHAVIIRSALTRVPVLVSMSRRQTWVNGRPVVTLQVLRQRDRIQLGQVRLTLWEVRVTSLQKDDRWIRKQCPFCKDDFAEGDEVVICPRCNKAHHRDCWFSIPTCAVYNCGYPSRSSVIDALSPWVKFERRLMAGSELVEVKDENGRVVKEGKKCQANDRRDQVPFQEGDQIAYCPSPSCRTTYHLVCWLLREKCRVCGYDIRRLMDQVFSTSTDDIPEMVDAYAR